MPLHSEASSQAQETAEDDDATTTTLQRHFSACAVKATTSDWMSSLRPGEQLQILGLGTCGSVFGIPGSNMVIKKGGDVKALWNDFCLTTKVFNAFDRTRNALQDIFPTDTIPRCPRARSFFLPGDEGFWGEYLGRLPTSHRRVGAVIEMERIAAVPRPVRDGLVDRYFDADGGYDEEEEESEACLVRVYLGENEKDTLRAYGSLLNFPLRLNMMRDLKMDVGQLADEMAIALAVMHWEAGVDAMDVEFVLGSSSVMREKRLRKAPDPDEEPRSVSDALAFVERDVHIWVLDLDKAKRVVDMTLESVVRDLVPAFLGNDPYFPRPDVDGGLWMRFGDAYLKASWGILGERRVGEGVMGLPGKFLEEVERKIEEVKDWDPEKDITFG
ncbi:MAG: hypothetical protein LQ349_005109 [Xanthoria aureola]|nr:MAG: hypothetical protein LQ349_005109 [Xanthoria aureola]